MIAHGWSPEEIHFQHPHLSLAQIHAALGYYYDHKAEMDAQIQRSAQDVEKLRKDASVKIGTGMGTGAQFLAFDYSHDKLVYGDAQGRNPFRDLKVRQALRYALDIQY